MTGKTRRAARCWSTGLAAAAASALYLAAAPAAQACSVCFSANPDDRMVQGAASGILLMVAVTYGTLLILGAVGAVWFVRMRRIRVRPQ